jgi:hypothetical protein
MAISQGINALKCLGQHEWEFDAELDLPGFFEVGTIRIALPRQPTELIQCNADFLDQRDLLQRRPAIYQVDCPIPILPSISADRVSEKYIYSCHVYHNSLEHWSGFLGHLPLHTRSGFLGQERRCILPKSRC